MTFCVPQSLVYTQQSSLVTFLSLAFLGIKDPSNQSQSSIVLEPLTRLSSKVSIIYTRGKSHLYEARHCKNISS